MKKSDGTSMFTVDDATGNTVISGTLGRGCIDARERGRDRDAVITARRRCASATLNGDLSTSGDIAMSKTASAITHTAATGATSGLTISSDNGFVVVKSTSLYVDVEDVRFTSKTIGIAGDTSLITLASAGVGVTGTLTSSGLATLASATVTGALSAGATTITGATGITGATTITGATVMKGDVTVKKSDGTATVLTVAGATGNTVVSGNARARVHRRSRARA